MSSCQQTRTARCRVICAIDNITRDNVQYLPCVGWIGLELNMFAPSGADKGWLHGLKIAAVAVVAQAVWSMGRQLCPDRIRASFAIVAALLVLAWGSPLAQFAAIIFGAIAG